MFILISTYTKPVEEVNEQLDAHRAWLQGLYAEGRILVSGRRDPLVGGVVILRAQSRAELDELLTHDPYVRHELVDYEIVAFDETPFPHRSEGFDRFAATPVTTSAAAGN